MKATGVLMNEHREILKALHVMERMGEIAAGGGVIIEKDVEEILEFLDLFGDKHHQGREEAVLFPAMMGKNPANCDKLRHMAFEHDQERSLVQGLQEALKTHRAKDFAYYAGRLVQILRAHIYKEDHILFEMADAGLTPEEDARMYHELAAYEPDWEKNVAPRLLSRLRELEWRYLGRSATLPPVGSDEATARCEFR